MQCIWHEPFIVAQVNKQQKASITEHLDIQFSGCKLAESTLVRNEDGEDVEASECLHPGRYHGEAPKKSLRSLAPLRPSSPLFASYGLLSVLNSYRARRKPSRGI